MAETTIGLFKTELHRNPAGLHRNGGPWRGPDDLELAECEWVSWFNTERLHPSRVGLSMDVADIDAFQAVMESEAGAAAMKHDGVRPETLIVLVDS